MIKNFSTKTRWLVTILLLATLAVSNVWATDYSWSLPWSTSYGAKNSSDGNASIRLYNSSGSTNGGSYTTRTDVGSHISVPSGGYFLIRVPISSASTSFTLNAEIYGWKSSAYAKYSVSVEYYSSKSASTTSVCSGNTSTSGCYSISETKSLTSTYTEDNGTLYIKISPAQANIGFESLSVTVSSGTCSTDVAIGAASLNGSFLWTGLYKSIMFCKSFTYTHAENLVVMYWSSRILPIHIIYFVYYPVILEYTTCSFFALNYIFIVYFSMSKIVLSFIFSAG